MNEQLTARAKLIYERDNNSPLFLRAADFYLSNNEPQNAISILENGLTIFPDHPLAFILMGKAKLMLDEIEMAEFFFKKSSELLFSRSTFTYYKNKYKLPDRQLSPFDSSRGSIFINSSSEDMLQDEIILNRTNSVDDRLSEIAEKLINKKLEHTNDIPLRETNQQEYSPNKSRLASETFANIYLSQGQKNEAIKIYELLVHRNPGKKEYYLGKIKELQSQ